MRERGQSPHELSAVDEGTKLMARNVFDVFSQFRRAGFTRREALELTIVFYKKVMNTPD